MQSNFIIPQYQSVQNSKIQVMITFTEAEKLLQKSYSEIKKYHNEKGHQYIKLHWNRYVNLLSFMPPVKDTTRVLEIGPRFYLLICTLPMAVPLLLFITPWNQNGKTVLTVSE